MVAGNSDIFSMVVCIPEGALDLKSLGREISIVEKDFGF